MDTKEQKYSIRQFEFPMKISVSRPQFKAFEVLHYLAGDSVELEDNVDIEIGTYSSHNTEVLVVARIRKGLVMGIYLSPCSAGWLVSRHGEPELNRLFEHACNVMADQRKHDAFPLRLRDFIKNIVIGPVDIDIEGECLVICHAGWCCYYCENSEFSICFGPPVIKTKSKIES